MTKQAAGHDKLGGFKPYARYGANWLFSAGLLAGSIGLGIGMFLDYAKKRSYTRPESKTVQNAISDTDATSPKRVKLSFAHGKLFEKSVLTTSLVVLFSIMPYGAIIFY